MPAWCWWNDCKFVFLQHSIARKGTGIINSVLFYVNISFGCARFQWPWWYDTCLLMRFDGASKHYKFSAIKNICKQCWYQCRVSEKLIITRKKNWYDTIDFSPKLRQHLKCMVDWMISARWLEKTAPQYFTTFFFFFLLITMSSSETVYCW